MSPIGSHPQPGRHLNWVATKKAGDRLIGATALQLGSRLISADAKLRQLPELDTRW